jgi:quinol monooxygenase YgiN
MINVVARNFVRADKVDAFITGATQLVRDTRQYDAGCIRYELVQDLKNPQVLTFLEEWEDQESLSRHMEASHFKEAAPLFSDYLDKPGDVNIYRTLA